MADREIWSQANAQQTILVEGGTKILIPAVSSGGVSRNNMVNALLQSGALDQRGLSITTAVYALEAMPWHPQSPGLNAMLAEIEQAEADHPGLTDYLAAARVHIPEDA